MTDAEDYFIDQIDACLAAQYGLHDGGDLAFNLLERGDINPTMSIEHASQIVAQHMVQA